ncbi:MAG: hypothetical protein M0018_12560, partial [Nitrospiraceae bacterium]|nr:hypothetical protein [Nitrospiraceae bacterium]
MGAFKKLLIAALLLAVAFGLWTSFHYTFKAYSLDGDAAFFPMLWHGWREHGLDFFRSWNFDQDNWLFSPAPLVFLAYYVFGLNGYTVLGLGWAFFVVNALLLAIMTRFLLGRWSLAALVALCLGLFAGEHAMKKGLLAYTVCHNTSMAWTFIAVITAAYGIEKLSGLCAFILACITFIAAVSDPWFNAACSMPLVLVLSVMSVKGKGHRRQSRNLLLGIAAGWALAYTRLLGLASFLSKGSIQFISSPVRMFANVHSYIAAVDAFLPSGQILACNHIAGTLFIIISLVLAFESFRWLALRIKYLQARQAMIAGFFLCSILIMSAAFLFLLVDAGPYRFRYLVNVYYGLLVIAVFVFAFRWADLPVIFRAAASIWVLIFMAAGVASDPVAWEKAAKVNDQGASALARFLDQNGLHYGYGDYFAASADTVSWVSGYRNI